MGSVKQSELTGGDRDPLKCADCGNKLKKEERHQEQCFSCFEHHQGDKASDEEE